MAVPFRVKISIGKQVLQLTDESTAAQATRLARQSMQEVIDNLRDLIKHTKDILPESMIYALEPVKDLADVYCPVDTGTMKASGYLEITQYGDTPQVEMGYGRGGEPPYTPIVHEDLQSYHAPPTSAKWLERAFKELQTQIEPRLAEHIKAALGESNIQLGGDEIQAD